MTSEMKSCPFCASSAEITEYHKDNFEVQCSSEGCGVRPNTILSDKETVVADWNTRAMPDAPELVRYSPVIGADGWVTAIKTYNGEYVRHDQAVKVIGDVAAEAELNHIRAEAAEAKLAQIEKQVAVCWRWRPKDGSVWFYDPKMEWLDEQDVAFIDKEPLYTAPVASDADLRAENEDLRGHAARIIAAFDEENDLDNPEKFNAYFDLKAALNPSEPRT